MKFEPVDNPQCITRYRGTEKIIKSKDNLVCTRYASLRLRTSTTGFKLEDGRFVIGYGGKLLLIDENKRNYKVYKTIHYFKDIENINAESYKEIIENLDVLSPDFRKFLRENRISPTRVMEDVDKFFVKRYLMAHGGEFPMNKLDMEFINGKVAKKLDMSSSEILICE